MNLLIFFLSALKQQYFSRRSLHVCDPCFDLCPEFCVRDGLQLFSVHNGGGGHLTAAATDDEPFGRGLDPLDHAVQLTVQVFQDLPLLLDLITHPVASVGQVRGLALHPLDLAGAVGEASQPRVLVGGHVVSLGGGHARLGPEDRLTLVPDQVEPVLPALSQR